MATYLAWQSRTAASAKGLLGGLDHPATLLVRRPPPKHSESVRPLLTDG